MKGICKICKEEKELKCFKYYDYMCLDCAKKIGLLERQKLSFQTLNFDLDNSESKKPQKKTPKKEKIKVEKSEPKEITRLKKINEELEFQLDGTTKQLVSARNYSMLKDKIIDSLKMEIKELERQVDKLERFVEDYKKGKVN